MPGPFSLAGGTWDAKAATGASGSSMLPTDHFLSMIAACAAASRAIDHPSKSPFAWGS